MLLLRSNRYYVALALDSWMLWAGFPKWRLAKGNLTRESVPEANSAAEYCLIICFIFVLHLHGINPHLHGSCQPPHSKSQNWRHII